MQFNALSGLNVTISTNVNDAKIVIYSNKSSNYVANIVGKYLEAFVVDLVKLQATKVLAVESSMVSLHGNGNGATPRRRQFLSLRSS